MGEEVRNSTAEKIVAVVAVMFACSMTLGAVAARALLADTGAPVDMQYAANGTLPAQETRYIAAPPSHGEPSASMLADTFEARGLATARRRDKTQSCIINFTGCAELVSFREVWIYRFETEADADYNRAIWGESCHQIGDIVLLFPDSILMNGKYRGYVSAALREKEKK